MASEHNLSFEQLSSLREKGLMPQEGNFNEPLPMAEVRRLDEIKILRDKVLVFAKGKTVGELESGGQIQEFGKLLGNLQQFIEMTGKGEAQDALEAIMETCRVFSELVWDEEYQDELELGIDLATNLGMDINSLLQNLGEPRARVQ